MTKKVKNNLILVAILAILIIALVVWQNPFAPKYNQVETENLITNNLDNLQIIEINKTNQTISLKKENDTWIVTSQENVLANEDLIADLIDTLNELNSGTIVSRNLDKLDDFSLSQEKAVNLKLVDTQGGTIIEILVGKLGGPAYTQTYVKNINSNNILLVDANLINKVNQQDWKQPPPPPEDEEGGSDTIPIE